MWRCDCGNWADGTFCERCGHTAPDSNHAAKELSSASKPSENSARLDARFEKATDYLKSIVTLRGKKFQVGRFYLLIASALVAVACCLTAIGYWTSNVPLICGAGLFWILLLMIAFLVFRFMHWLAETIRHSIKRLATWFRTSTDDIETLATAAEMIADAVLSGLSKFIYVVMAAIALCVEYVTRFHMHLANSALQQEHHVAELSWKSVSVLSIVVTSVGGLATVSPWLQKRFIQFVEFVKPRFGIRKDIRDLERRARQVAHSPRVVIEFLSSFEFCRCLLILFTGLWGLAAFHSVSTILNIPSDDGSIILLANHARRQAAYDLYGIQGWFLYNFFFAFLPSVFVVISLIRRYRSKGRGYRPIFGLQHHAAAVTAGVLLLLALNVWYRVGIIPRYFIAVKDHFHERLEDKYLSSCLFNSHAPEEDYACLLDWNRTLEQQLNRLDAAVETRILPKNKAPFDETRNEWRAQELDARIRAFAQYPEPYEKTLALMLRGDAIETQIAHLNMLIAAPVSHPSLANRRRRAGN
jgi:hypothetical protein